MSRLRAGYFVVVVRKLKTGGVVQSVEAPVSSTTTVVTATELKALVTISSLDTLSSSVARHTVCVVYILTRHPLRVPRLLLAHVARAPRPKPSSPVVF